MGDDGVVKAPVTRLRRRLSVELSEECKSPAGPSTPTKKRGGRLAAKPQLDLIDENTPQNSPKVTTRRRSTARDLAEVEEKLLTPSRRSTRIKSNTSILSDTPQTAFDSPRAMRALRRNSQIGSDSEPTPVTPARARRGRKDSTTSLDKQATASSASGTPVTPVRARRTRKDSASNVDKPAENEEATALINEVIAEEPENNLRKSIISEKKLADTPISPRKSPRLLNKNNRTSKSENEENESTQEPDVNMNISAGKSKLNIRKSETTNIRVSLESKQDVIDGTSQSRLSLSSANILNNLDDQSNKKPNLNKSTSSLLQIPTDIETKRQRTKSWTTQSSVSSKEGSFYSDNEITKKKIINKTKPFTMILSNQLKSGDSALIKNDIQKSKISLEGTKENNAERYLDNSIKKKKYGHNKTSDRMKESMLNQSTNNKNKSLLQSPKPSNNNPEGNQEKVDDKMSNNPSEMLFQKAPSSSIQSVLVIEDSDSNTESLGKTNKNIETESEDQRVPEVEQVNSDEFPKKSESNILNSPTKGQLFTSLPTTINNDTCEPMDIDETMPENVSISDHSGENKSVNECKNKSSYKSDSLCISHDVSANKSINKFKRKSSLCISLTQDHEKTDNGNKSTLILSQIKDLSTGDQETSKTSNDSRQISEQLSKSLQEPHKSKNVNKNISMSCLTSTPVQQKNDKKLPLQMNTSAITPHNESKKIITEKKINISMVSKSSESGSSDEGSDDDSEHNSLVVDEAEDGGNNYQSGDSQDEEERQYERDHEIVDKGVTLTSEDEVSNDSDYEKDSFIVSSDEEDNELLSGSGEDLDMSSNELTMSAKSKKNYNERLSKQQKKASREMFQARHRLDESDQKSRSKDGKNNKMRLDSKLLESGDDIAVPPKKKKRMRLESTMDSSAAKSDAEESKPEPTETVEVEEIEAKKKKTKCLSESEPGSEIEATKSRNHNDVQDKSESEEIGYRKKKSKRLSESICNESVFNEKEITEMYNTTTIDDPLQLQIKHEPKTPQSDFDISTVHFTIGEVIEQVQVKENASIMKVNETSDPLQASITQDEDNKDSDNDNSSISENEEITKNYESMLSKLNEDTKQKIKSVDVSLNLNKKIKQKAKQTVIEQLNITQTKNTKSKKNVKTSKPKSIFVNTAASDEDDATSDSVDLKLLFSDDSNDSANVSSVLQNKTETVNKIISLKGNKDNINISSSLNASQNQANDTSLNTSNKKKNKLKSNQKDITTDDTNGQTVPFFIDRVGYRDEPLNNSASTMKNKNNSITYNGDFDIGIKGNSKDVCFDYVVHADASITNLKNKTKLRKVSLSIETDASIGSETYAKPTIIITPSSEKKKKSVGQDGKLCKGLPINKMHDKSVDDQKVTMETISGVNKIENKKRKRLSSAKDAIEDVILQDSVNDQVQMNESMVSNSKKKRKLVQNEEVPAISETMDRTLSDKKNKPLENNENKSAEKSRKRKEREDDVNDKKSKVLKQNTSEKKKVPRLTPTILEQLEDKSKKQFNKAEMRKVMSTTQFKVEETRTRRNKPSNFLEESIYLNTDSESPNVKKQKLKVGKPTVLPFTPTASISDSGFTTKFHITPIPQKIEFVAQRNETTNFKIDYLKARRSKKLRTHELYKSYRNVKLSKY